MISICSVVLNSIKHYEEIFLESILRKTKIVSEVILAQNDREHGYEEWHERGITFKRFGAKDAVMKNFGKTYGHEHGLGLNFAIARATNETVYLVDPDVFFYSAADEFFYDLMQKYQLNAIGCSHHAATELSHTFFPWHGNIMLKKAELPNNEWLKEELMGMTADNYIGPRIIRPNPEMLKGKFMFPSLGYGFRSEYPKPEGNFDTGSGLWLYAHQRNWKWLSFQTNCVHVYTKMYCRGNFKLTEKFGRDKLIHHAVSGSIEKGKWEPYNKSYQETKND